MSGWRATTIGELIAAGEVRLQTGPFGSQLHSHDYVLAGTPVIPTEAIGHRVLREEGLPQVDAATVQRLARHRVRAGDILFARRGIQATGYSAIVQERHEGWLCGTGAILLRVEGRNVDPAFLSFALADARSIEWLKQHAVGAVMPNLNAEVIAGLPLLVPDLSEQRAIAEVLGVLDDKIGLNQRIGLVLTQLARAQFACIYFADGAECWQTTTLGDCVEVVRGLSYKGAGLSGDGMPMHNLNSIYEGGGYKYEGLKRYSGEYKSRHVVEAGDLIVANTEQGHELRLIGFSAVVPRTFGEYGLFSQHLYRVRPLSSSYLSSHFLHQLLLLPEVREQVVGCTNGTTVNMLAIDGLQRPCFRLPPQEVVRSFDALASSIECQQEALRSQSGSLAALRDELLPRLLSGELRVRDAEPALAEAGV